MKQRLERDGALFTCKISAAHDCSSGASPNETVVRNHVSKFSTTSGQHRTKQLILAVVFDQTKNNILLYGHQCWYIFNVSLKFRATFLKAILIMESKSVKFFIIKWLEEPPSWDVIRDKDIKGPQSVLKLLNEDGPNEVIGLAVDVKWKESTSPAKVLRFSCK